MKYEPVSEGNKRKLLIKNIDQKDAANYWCEAVATDSRVKIEFKVEESHEKAINPTHDRLTQQQRPSSPMSGSKFSRSSDKFSSNTGSYGSSNTEKSGFDFNNRSARPGTPDTVRSPAFNTAKVPAYMDDSQKRNFLLQDARAKDMESKRKWVRDEKCWNKWVINPEYAMKM